MNTTHHPSPFTPSSAITPHHAHIMNTTQHPSPSHHPIISSSHHLIIPPSATIPHHAHIIPHHPTSCAHHPTIIGYLFEILSFRLPFLKLFVFVCLFEVDSPTPFDIAILLLFLKTGSRIAPHYRSPCDRSIFSPLGNFPPLSGNFPPGREY